MNEYYYPANHAATQAVAYMEEDYVDWDALADEEEAVNRSLCIAHVEEYKATLPF